MGKYLLAVPSSAHAGRDDEYNDWYDREHLADVCAIPGVISGRRFDALPTSPGQPPATCLALYEIETDDPMTVLAELGQRVSSGEAKISSALDPSSAAMWLYKAH